MRKRKFRGFSVELNKWVQGDSIYYPQTGKDKGRVYIGCIKAGLEEWLLVYPNSVGEFTGYMDINDQEIYEGDIIKIVNNYNDETKKHPDIVFIDFVNGGFVTQIPEDERKDLGFIYLNRLDSYNFPIVTFEVVGTMYETPDLVLKGYRINPLLLEFIKSNQELFYPDIKISSLSRGDVKNIF